jgi:hypothetical protein
MLIDLQYVELIFPGLFFLFLGGVLADFRYESLILVELTVHLFFLLRNVKALLA